MPLPPKSSATGQNDAGRTLLQGALGRFTRLLGRLGLGGASVALVFVAVLLAEAAHILFVLLRGDAYTLWFAIDVAVVTIVVATPIIVYAQLIIRKLGTSRRALKQVTERLAVAVDAAEQANVAKSQFLANMSHELRTPLHAIIGFSDMIQAETFGPVGNPRYIEYLKDVTKSGHHLLGIINSILDLSKIEAGRANVQDEEEFNVAAVLDASMRMMRPLADREKVALELSVEARGLRLVAVERMVCQILLNLLSNAVKFTPAGGIVAIRAELRADGGVAIVVADTGLGIAPEDMPRLFQAFQQAENTRRHNPEGTGLGLVISRRLMEKHGGTLTLESEPGKGTHAIAAFPKEAVIADAKPARRTAAMAA
jgi:signal transduction histidine kinase